MPGQVGEATPSNEPMKWYQNKKVLTVAAIMGLALGLLSLGIIVAAMGTSSHWYYSTGVNEATGNACKDIPTCDPDIPYQVSNANEIEDALQYGAKVGG